MLKYLLFAISGFISGSVMYSYLIPKHFCEIDTVEQGSDHNPGATNAMRCAGTKIGILCLLLDIAKGFVPVFVAKSFLDINYSLFALVIVAPVIGHAFSPLMKFRGGKAIAASCGVLGALLPDSFAIIWLLLIMTVFSLVIVVKPDSLRMIVSMLVLIAVSFATNDVLPVKVAVISVSAIVILKHFMNYGDEKKAVRLFFMKK